MAEQNGDLGSFLSGLIIGGLIGAAAALLMAPQSGEETRTLIKERSIELKDRAAETAEEARLRAEELAAEARHRAEELTSEARHKAGEISQQARTRADELVKRGQEVYEEQKGKIESARKKGEEPSAGEPSI